MQTGQPSRTALGAAIYRAAHQTLEGGRIFSDPLARTVLGPEADALISAFSADPAQLQMRVFMAVRSRFAEDCLARAVSRGVRQVVILGAGLDTSRCATRMPHWACGYSKWTIRRPRRGSARACRKSTWPFRPC